jgi:hypothetical protein
MAYSDELKKALDKYVPATQLHYLSGWKNTWYRSTWRAANGKPVALMLHHTAGAATSSTNPGNAGNQHGANDGQIKYVNRHPQYDMPCSAFTLDRDGCIYVNAALPCYHAGKGTFNGTQWSSLGVPTDMANDYCLGVECVDKGVDKTFTEAMKASLANLAKACEEASGWKDTSTLYVPRHRDWAPDRKVDIKYSNTEVQGWMVEFDNPPLWDGQVPSEEGCFNAMNYGLANPQAYRIAARLHDLGFYSGEPQPSGVQKYPVKAVSNFQESKAIPTNPAGAWSPEVASLIFS